MSQYQQLCLSITEHLKSQLSRSNLQIVCNVIFALVTQGWEKTLATEEESSESRTLMEAIARLGVRYLESNGVVSANLKE